MRRQKGYEKAQISSRTDRLRTKTIPQKVNSNQIHIFKSNSTQIKTAIKEFSFPSIFSESENSKPLGGYENPIQIKEEDESSESDWYQNYKEQHRIIKEKEQEEQRAVLAKEKKIKKERKGEKRREEESQGNNFMKFKIKLRDYEDDDFRIVRVNRDPEDNIIFKVEKKNGEKKFITNSEMKSRYPQKIISYYERKIKWPSHH